MDFDEMDPRHYENSITTGLKAAARSGDDERIKSAYRAALEFYAWDVLGFELLLRSITRDAGFGGNLEFIQILERRLGSNRVFTQSVRAGARDSGNQVLIEQLKRLYPDDLLYDTVAGVYQLTDPASSINQNIANEIYSRISYPDLTARLSRYDIPFFSGPALFSSILPPDLHYHKGGVMISDGVLIRGRIKVGDLSPARNNSIYNIIEQQYGHQRAQDFLNNLVAIADAWYRSLVFGDNTSYTSP